MTTGGNGNDNENVLKTDADEIEILVFTIKDQVFGVNVLQVREILMPSPLDKIPHGHKSVEGVYMPRDVLITVINLADYLDIYLEAEDRTLFIVVDVKNLNAAFRVNNVLGIERISTNNIGNAEASYGRGSVMSGIVRINGKLISLIDFAKVVADISR